jgi:4-amino-4-deoxy-L-arabinose transferase-like glycosyltransferase
VRDRALTAGVFAVAMLAILAGLGAYGLWDPDEGRHAAIARAVYAAPDWRGLVVPTHNFAAYHDKPILYYWLTGAAYALAGPNELGARLVSAIAALLTLIVVFRWTAVVWDARTARRAVLVLLTSLGFLGLARYGNLDMLVTCWITIGILAAERFTATPERRSLLVVAGAAAGLGLLTKGLEAPLFIAAVPLLHAWLVGRPLPGPRAWAIAAATLLLVAGPWYVAASMVDPAYIREFILVHHLARATAGGTTFHAGPWWYYGPAVALMLFPWSVLLPATLMSEASRRDEGATLCLCWAGMVIGVFSLSHGKLATYILPALPPLAVVTARAVGVVRTPAERQLAGVGLALLVATLLAALPTAMAIDHARWSVVIAAARPHLLLLPACAVVLTAWWWRRGIRVATTLIAPFVVLVGLVFYREVAPAVSRMAGEQAIARVIATRLDAPIVSYAVTPASLMFYVERPILRVSRIGPLRRALAEQQFTWIVTSHRHVEELGRVATVYPWVTTGRHVLYATAPAAAMASATDGEHVTN